MSADLLSSIRPIGRFLALLPLAWGLLLGQAALASTPKKQTQHAKASGQGSERHKERHQRAKTGKAVAAGSYSSRSDAMQWAEDAAQRIDLPADWVRQQIGQARRIPQIEQLVLPASTPAAKNWRAYRSRFIEPRRIEAGAAFWQRHQATLERAEQTYGVPASIIVGIIGVETLYGQHMGNFRIMDALATLSLQLAQSAAPLSAAGALVTRKVGQVKIRAFTAPGTRLALEAVLQDADALRARLKVTARSGDTLTIVRAQEGTTAQAWSAGAKVELRLTAQMLFDALAEEVSKSGDTMLGDLNFAGFKAQQPRLESYRETVTTVTPSAGTATCNLSTANVFDLTLTSSSTALAFSNPPASGLAFSFTVIVRQDATGNRALTYPASVKFTDSVTPVLATGASKVDVLTFFTVDGGTTYFGGQALANL